MRSSCRGWPSGRCTIRRLSPTVAAWPAPQGAGGARAAHRARPGSRLPRRPDGAPLPHAVRAARRDDPLGPVHRQEGEPGHAPCCSRASRRPRRSPPRIPPRSRRSSARPASSARRRSRSRPRRAISWSASAARCRRRSTTSSTLRGVARKTANVVLGNAFGIPGIAVDTHMTRVNQRLGLTAPRGPGEDRSATSPELVPARRLDALHEPRDPPRPRLLRRAQAALRGVPPAAPSVPYPAARAAHELRRASPTRVARSRCLSQEEVVLPNGRRVAARRRAPSGRVGGGALRERTRRAADPPVPPRGRRHDLGGAGRQARRRRARACARAELEEEAGRRAGRLETLGAIWTTPGFTDELIHLFAAFDLEAVPLRHEPDEVIEVVRMPLVARARAGLGRRAPRREERPRAAPRGAPRRGCWERAAVSLGVSSAGTASPSTSCSRWCAAPRALGYARGVRGRRRLGDRPSRGDGDVLDGWTRHDRAARAHRAHRRSARSACPHHWNAARLAQAVATRSGSFPGRLRFLASIGAQRADRRFGLALPPGGRAHRVARRDARARCARSGAASASRCAGRFVQLDGRARATAAAGGRMPIEVGARRAAAARRGRAPRRPLGREPAADRGAAWRTRRRSSRAACAAEGRDPASIGRSMWVFARPGRDRRRPGAPQGVPPLEPLVTRISPTASSARRSWREAPRAAARESRRSAAISASTCRFSTSRGLT